MSERPSSGSAERELATPEVAAQHERTRENEDDAPSAKRFETEGDESLPEDQQAMQPDSE